MSDLCRFCAEYKPLEDLSCITDDDSTITFKLESSLKIVLDNDKLLPKSACSTCLNTLDIAFKFAEQVASVQEKLKTDLQEKLNSMQINSNIDELDVMKNFEIKIERLDTSLYEFLPSAEVSVKGKTTNKRSTESKKEPKNVSKKRIGRRTFGLTKPIKITMDSLFKEELKGNFVGATEEMDIDDEDKMPLGTLSSRAKDRLATIGWCNYEWKCRECGETFSNVIQLEKHSIKAHKKRCIIHCEPCFDIYKNYTRFLDHVTTKHQPLLKFSCIICSEIRTSYRHLYDHIVEAHPDYSVFLCLYCGEIKFAGSIMKDHIADYHVPVANKFSCDLCEKTFNTKSKICSHMAYTHAQRSFICEWCAASYRQQHELSSHQNYHHSELRNESCSFCKEVNFNHEHFFTKKIQVTFSGLQKQISAS